MDKRRIPIIAGAEGRFFAAEPGCETIREEIQAKLTALRDQYPHSEVLLLAKLSSEEDFLRAETAAGEVLAAPSEEYVRENSHLLFIAGRSNEAGESGLLQVEIPDKAALDRIEEFNRLVREKSYKGGHILREASGEDPVMDHIRKIYHSASGLSHNYADIYRNLLAMLAVASTILTMAFLLYDEAQMIWMILICGGMLVAAWVFHHRAVRSDCHRRYIEYRVLAEWLRVQGYLRYAGSNLAVTDLLTWTQRQETGWVVAALKAINMGPPPAEKHGIRECWVNDQRDYHHSAANRSSVSLKNSEGVVKTALVLSIVLYVDVLVLELLFGGLIFPPAATIPNIEFWRLVLKIALGSLSAATVFIANYFGKQSLPRVCSDHAKMEKFYSWISEEIGKKGQTPQLLELLAREELIENGNWVSYQRDNTPDISL